MIAILSPAKTLDYETRRDDMPDATEPRFSAEASELARAAAGLSVKRIGEIMSISEALSRLNADRYRNFDAQEARPAIQAFDGDVYDGLDARTLDRDRILFSQTHLRMLSGMYGLLRPLDAMRPYRMEMGTKWAPRLGRITDWWGDRIADALVEDLDASGSRDLLNLASEEYFKSVEGRLPEDVRVVDVHFVTGDRFVTFHAKVARGVMARWMIEHGVTDIETMKGFDAGGYAYVAGNSTADRWTFRRAE
jgi:cytoplasmic iron level regulating protein YaaA (DUF328/UPF0246 family)